MFPAQLCNLSGTLFPRASHGAKIDCAPAAPLSFKNVRFFMVDSFSPFANE
jgi:hypothetical protein